MRLRLVSLLAVFTALSVLSAHANTGVILDKAPDHRDDLPALQKGAQIFINNCLGCHAAASVRYSSLINLGLTETQIKENLLFTGNKVSDLMINSMKKTDAKAWFGVAPPDLSIITRARSSADGSGSDWVYTYLRSFYRDDMRPTGWNNVIFPNVAMPHVLTALQGVQKLDVKGEHHELVLETPGSMTRREYDDHVGNLVGFLDWMAEPGRSQHQKMGYFVLLALLALVFITWRLNKAYWKDIK